MGSKFVSDSVQTGHIARSEFTGTGIINKGIVHLPGGIDQTGYYMGALDGRTPYGTIFGAGPVASFSTPPTVPADSKRRPLSRREWMNEFFTTTSEPVGHGFSQSNLADDFACYSFMPKSTIPIKVIVLDNTVRESAINPSTQISGYGYLDQKRFDWLVSELKEGQNNNKLMIVAAHIPFAVEPAGAPAGFLNPATEAALIQELHNHPNVLMFLAGHRHVNLIKPFPSPDPTKPECGFWQVETCSLREFPQEFRIFEIRRNSDKTVSILATNVDPAVKEGTPAATSRTYGIAAGQAFGFSMSDPRLEMANAELLKTLTATMAAVLENYGTAIH
jgi:metallophosphoesterase (TIGR03768 family)